MATKQTITSLRPTAVSGTFYPKQCHTLRAFFDHANQTSTIPAITHPIKALLVPHAGYIYSGQCADLAYRTATTPPHIDYKRIVIIGPSHHIYLEGISASFYEALQTPCGNLVVDTPYLIALAKHFPIGFLPKVHTKEHSTEVQFPFVKHYFPNAKAIELIYGDIEVTTLAQLILALWQNPKTLVVISTDLSHYYPLETANQKDTICTNAFTHGDPKQLTKACEACGRKGLEALLLATKHIGYSTKLLCHTTSATTSGDTQRVVGYMSGVVYNSHQMT